MFFYQLQDSFNTTFDEAVKCCDEFQVYMEAINMLASAQKFSEMERKIKKARGKFKHVLEMWTGIARVYYSLERFDDARKLKDAALKSKLDKQTGKIFGMK